MHELSITRSIVAIVADNAKERPVKRVKVQIGKLAGVDVEAVRFCFDLCAKGTVVDGATLEVDEVEGRGRCCRCDKEVPLQQLVAICPCEVHAPMQVLSGQELLVKEMEL